VTLLIRFATAARAQAGQLATGPYRRALKREEAAARETRKKRRAIGSSSRTCRS